MERQFFRCLVETNGEGDKALVLKASAARRSSSSNGAA
jgi:hypothetical protein